MVYPTQQYTHSCSMAATVISYLYNLCPLLTYIAIG